jgi:hypothetical protein
MVDDLPKLYIEWYQFFSELEDGCHDHDASIVDADCVLCRFCTTNTWILTRARIIQPQELDYGKQIRGECVSLVMDNDCCDGQVFLSQTSLLISIIIFIIYVFEMGVCFTEYESPLQTDTKG